MVNLRRPTRALALLCLLPAASACPGDDTDGEGALVGTWELADDGDAEAARYSFDADGSFTYDELDADEDAEHVQGTYTVDGSLLTMEGVDTTDDETGRVEATYHAAGDRFALGAYLADGEHDGPVGTWASHSIGDRLDDDGESIERTGFDAEIELRADRTVDLDATVFGAGGSADVGASGTWSQDDDVVTVSLGLGDGTTTTAQLLILGEDVMGDVVLDRVDDAAASRSSATVARALSEIRRAESVR